MRQSALILKPGPKVNARMRHRQAALYFAVTLVDGGSSAERASELMQTLYGVSAAPLSIREFHAVVKKFAESRTREDFSVELK